MTECWTLAEARQHVAECLTAIRKLRTSQSYSIGGQTFTRANMEALYKDLKFWQNEVERLSAGSRRGASQTRIVIRDI